MELTEHIKCRMLRSGTKTPSYKNKGFCLLSVIQKREQNLILAGSNRRTEAELARQIHQMGAATREEQITRQHVRTDYALNYEGHTDYEQELQNVHLSTPLYIIHHIHVSTTIIPPRTHNVIMTFIPKMSFK